MHRAETPGQSNTVPIGDWAVAKPFDDINCHDVAGYLHTVPATEGLTGIVNKSLEVFYDIRACVLII